MKKQKTHEEQQKKMAKLKTNEKKRKTKKTLRKLTAHQKYYKNYNSKKY